MTGNLYLDLAISLGGVAILVAVSWLLGAWRSITLDEASARDRLAFDEPDFVVGEWLFGADRKSAVAISADGGELALVKPLGDGLATRRIKKGAAPVEAKGADVVIALGDPSIRKFRLKAADEKAAARWAGGLGGQGYI
ncbi:MAG: hypothetical protein WD076_10075 [Parvularculaceae bacterium]